MNKSDMQSNRLSSTQKTGFVLLLVFGILTIGLGLLQMRNTIYGPFVLRPATNRSQTVFLDETTRLQQTDTDRDGISDFEEIEFYQTSPYLPDTDSDGITDAEEIANGTNPLCPQGSDCDVVVESPKDNTLSTPLAEKNDPFGLLDSVGAAFDPAGLTTPSAAGLPPQFDLNAILSNPDQLRELLRSTGRIPEDQLESFDDDTLIQLADEVRKQQGLAPVSKGVEAVEEEDVGSENNTEVLE
jgi:hypothetical protein